MPHFSNPNVTQTSKELIKSENYSTTLFRYDTHTHTHTHKMAHKTQTTPFIHTTQSYIKSDEFNITFFPANHFFFVEFGRGVGGCSKSARSLRHNQNIKQK